MKQLLGKSTRVVALYVRRVLCLVNSINIDKLLGLFLTQ